MNSVTLSGMTTLVRLLSANALSPMLVMLSGIMTLVRSGKRVVPSFELNLTDSNALSAIEVKHRG